MQLTPNGCVLWLHAATQPSSSRVCQLVKFGASVTDCALPLDMDPTLQHQVSVPLHCCRHLAVGTYASGLLVLSVFGTAMCNVASATDWMHVVCNCYIGSPVMFLLHQLVHKCGQVTSATLVARVK